jgi:hypothetical protein
VDWDRGKELMNKLILFLTSISKYTLTEYDKDIISMMLQENHYDSIMPYIYRHRIQHLFFKHIVDLKLSFDLPDHILNSLGSQHSYLQFKFQEFVDEINTISILFEKRNVNYAILKGISLANAIYSRGQEVFRDFNDVDFLIEKKNTTIANDILTSLGYIQGEVNKEQEIVPADRRTLLYYSINSHQEQSYVKFSKYAAYSPYNRLYIDINTTIFEGGKMIPPISTDVLLSHFEKRNGISENYYKTLDKTFELMQICYHFYKDTIYEKKKSENENYCLMKFCDLREYVIQFRNSIDWIYLAYLLNEKKIAKQILSSLFLVDSLYGDLELHNFFDMLVLDKDSVISHIVNWENILL